MKKKRFLSIILVFILVLGNTITVFAANPDSETNVNADEGFEAARKAGYTYEQYQAIMSMPDFTDEAFTVYSTRAAMRPDQQAVVNMALSFQGVPYVWGGTSPSGFDCSGLVQYVYSHAVGISLPRVTTDQEKQGKEVSLGALLPGDLLFWGARGSSHHVAIYIGDNKFIQAPKPGDVVRVTGLYQYYPNFARRILPDSIAATSVTLNKYTIGLSVGESDSIVATVNPSSATDKSIVWSSSNSSVASVNAGYVTAKAVGTATITATNNASGKSSSCTIYVSGDIGSFITRLYSNALGRQPDSTTMNNFKNVVKNDSASKAVFDVFDSTEYRNKNYSDDQFVTMAYKAILGRDPDQSGKQNMLNLINNGMSRTYILSQITGSTEFDNYCKGLYYAERCNNSDGEPRPKREVHRICEQSISQWSWP